MPCCAVMYCGEDRRGSMCMIKSKQHYLIINKICLKYKNKQQWVRVKVGAISVDFGVCGECAAGLL